MKSTHTLITRPLCRVGIPSGSRPLLPVRRVGRLLPTLPFDPAPGGRRIRLPTLEYDLPAGAPVALIQKASASFLATVRCRWRGRAPCSGEAEDGAPGWGRLLPGETARPGSSTPAVV